VAQTEQPQQSEQIKHHSGANRAAIAEPTNKTTILGQTEESQQKEQLKQQ
jgi:hypothetical protein